MKLATFLLFASGFIAVDAPAQVAGHFLWHELLTNDKDAAIDFYGHVIGWDTQDWEAEGHQPYTMWMAGEAAVAGVMAIDNQTMGDSPPHWKAFVSSSDVDATLKQALDLGATVLSEPIDVPDVGQMAVMADPQGAIFAVYKPSGNEEPPAWPPGSMTFSWNELTTIDSDAAFDFYRQIFGWEKLDAVDIGEGWMYQIYGVGERAYGGIFDMPPGMTAPPRWLHYVSVDDLEAAVARVKERGGQVVYGPAEVPGGDMIAQCIDPQGAAFALHESKQ